PVTSTLRYFRPEYEAALAAKPATAGGSINVPTRVVTLQIDGQSMSARDDQSVIDVAREHGIRVPKLCYLDGLSVYGGCRLCLVEVEGTPKLLAACTTAAVEGMEVRTGSP